MTFRSILTATGLALLGTTAFSQTQFNNMVIFGDSLSDIGNNTWVTTQGRTGAPITNRPTANAPSIWTNDLNQNLFPGKTLYQSDNLPQGLDPNALNIDYAWASAETGSDYLNDDTSQSFPPYNDQACHKPGLIGPKNSCVPGVELQVKSYLTAVNYKPSPNTLFIIWAGGNDLFDDIAKIMPNNSTLTKEKLATLIDTLQENPKTAHATLSTPIKNLSEAIFKLTANGVNANQIYVINLPDLSKTPAARAFAKGNKIILDAVSMLSYLYDIDLHLTMSKQISGQHVIPAAKFFNDMISQPSSYHFTNVTNSCAADQKTPDCTGYLFFNDKHPTVQAHAAIGNFVTQFINNDGKNSH